MSTPGQAEIEQALKNLLNQPSPPKWLEEMIDHYRRTGTFRPEDLQRLFGDPSKGVTVGADTTIAGILSMQRK